MTQMELNRNLLNLNNRNFGSIEKFCLVENRLYYYVVITGEKKMHILVGSIIQNTCHIILTGFGIREKKLTHEN